MRQTPQLMASSGHKRTPWHLVRIVDMLIFILIFVMCSNRLFVEPCTGFRKSKGISTFHDLRGGQQTKHETEPASAEVRAKYVRHLLANRAKQVLNGERAKVFTRWALKQQELNVISTHGSEEVDVNEIINQNNYTQMKLYGDSTAKEQLFADDPLNLNIVEGLPAAPPPEYKGKPQHLIDDRPPNLMELFLRSIRLSINFAPVIWTTGLAVLIGPFRNGPYYRMVAKCLAASGPAFIKWGQWASTRNDMFPEALCVQLATLHNSAPAHGWKFTQKMMESSLGLASGSLLKVFESFDESPIASGSIAQVHRAVLRLDHDRDGGVMVAVKVRHPNVARLIDMDFRLMKAAAAVADWIPALAWLHIRDSVEQFSHTMAAQAHLNVEGHHLEILNFNFRRWKHVQFPKPIYASSSVIIETFEQGRIITDILDIYDAMATQVAIEQGTLTVEEVTDDDDDEMASMEGGEGYQFVPMSLAKFIVSTGVSIYLQMLLVDGLMHADLHPGNIMLDLAPAKSKTLSDSKALVPLNERQVQKNRLMITLVDAGMVAQLTPEESTNFIGLFCALGDGNGRMAAEFALRFSIETNLDEQERQGFCDDMAEMFKERCRGYGTNVDVGHVLRGVLNLIRKHQVRIDANYATLVINVLCIESLARRVCPSYNILDAAKPLLQTYQGLCYNTRSEVVEDPSFIKKAMVRAWIPLAYAIKKTQDNAFFHRMERIMKKEQKQEGKLRSK